MARKYGMRKRAEELEKTRDRIMAATMQLHDEKGVARTSFADIAQRAEVGQATVHRHFPTLGDLVRSCGMHVWQEMRPPVPEDVPAIFLHAGSEVERIERMVAHLDDFYVRGELRLGLAGRDRDLIPELEQFLSIVEAGVRAVVAGGLKRDAGDLTTKLVAAVLSFGSWSEIRKLDLDIGERRKILKGLVKCSIKAANGIRE